MPDDKPLHELTALEAARLLEQGRLTSTALVEHLLDRIAVHEPHLHALIAVHPQAREQAQASDLRLAAGVPLGPLDGVPVILKDNIEALGLPGSAGSLALAGSPAQRDAPLVARLRGAGLIILAAANLSEWANFRGRHSTSGWSAVGGLTQNPWRTGLSAGGSSSGSGAALAARYAPLAVGTDTDGSITCPAALCGVVGLKPTVGEIPVTGVAPISASQDSPGPMARTVADVAALLAVLVGDPDLASSVSAHEGGSRRYVLGAPSAWLTGVDAVDHLFAAVVDALRGAGIQVVPVDVALADQQVTRDEVTVLVHEIGDDLDAYLATRPGTGHTSLAAVVAFNAAHADVELAHFGQEHFEAAIAGGGRGAPQYGPTRARNLAWALDGALIPAFAHGVDALVAPAYGPAWRNDLGGGDAVAGGLVTKAPAIAGWPILTLPMGLVEGLPVGLSLVGPARGDATLLAIARVVEDVLRWGAPSPIP